MDGVHDMGSMHGFGTVEPEPEATEPVFHAAWEGRFLALFMTCTAHRRWTADGTRHSIERIPPARYLALSYYERWMDGLTRLLLETGLLSAAELASGRAEGPAAGVAAPLPADAVAPVLSKGRPTAMAIEREPRYPVSATVRVRVIHPEGHTRCPRYVRGRVGTVVLHHGGHVFADANAHGERRAEHLYTVAFAARELWGEAGSAVDTVRVDLWEPHLEPA